MRRDTAGSLDGLGSPVRDHACPGPHVRDGRAGLSVPAALSRVTAWGWRLPHRGDVADRVGRVLVGLTGPQDGRLVKGSADQLHAEWWAHVVESNRYRQGGQA